MMAIKRATQYEEDYELAKQLQDVEDRSAGFRVTSTVVRARLPPPKAATRAPGLPWWFAARAAFLAAFVWFVASNAK